jgi:hypothetical protein
MPTLASEGTSTMPAYLERHNEACKSISNLILTLSSEDLAHITHVLHVPIAMFCLSRWSRSM